MRAVGIVTQTGPYFFLASGVPRFGSSSANTIFAKEIDAAAANALKTKSLLPSCRLLIATFSLSLEFEHARIASARRLELVVAGRGGLERVAAEPPRNVVVMVVIETMGVVWCL